MVVIGDNEALDQLVQRAVSDIEAHIDQAISRGIRRTIDKHTETPPITNRETDAIVAAVEEVFVTHLEPFQEQMRMELRAQAACRLLQWVDTITAPTQGLNQDCSDQGWLQSGSVALIPDNSRPPPVTNGLLVNAGTKHQVPSSIPKYPDTNRHRTGRVRPRPQRVVKELRRLGLAERNGSTRECVMVDPQFGGSLAVPRYRRSISPGTLGRILRDASRVLGRKVVVASTTPFRLTVLKGGLEA
jgi:hypothetical protein